ncbi:hypothetical protein DM860_011843 [Cuscuta australis]|uniref:Protein kinase domain-containing protein n=1 Tax=Cuscuta australis TaxID=267555 RepID=A0A328DA67_9ASTE|nr:hypothetical protein DM860_011843 [Cuscuta australis]
MLHFIQLLLLISPTQNGVLRKANWLVLNQLLVLFHVLLVTNLPIKQADAQAMSSATLAVPDLPLRANRYIFLKQLRWKDTHIKSGVGPAPAPRTQSAPLAPYQQGSHPPSRSWLSKPSMRRSELVPPTAALLPPKFEQVAPAQSSASSLPLTQPPLSPQTSDCCGPDMVLKRGSLDCHCVYPIKLDLLLLNVSSNQNWTLFLDEFANNLGLKTSQIELINFYLIDLSKLNISMDITPYKGVSFSSDEVTRINSSLNSVRLNPALVGGYRLLNMTWFRAPVSSQAPSAMSPPMTVNPSRPSTPTPPSSAHKGYHSNMILIIGIVAGILIVVVMSMLILYACAYKRGKKKRLAKETVKTGRVDSVQTVASFVHPTSTRHLAYEELKEATANFAPSSVLGEGGFGRVFKGVLSDGTAVAIKRLSTGGQQGDKEFLVEVEMLSRLHHRNLVKLVGYYSSVDSSQNLLCYELVPNGSLEAWLHGPLGANCPLEWDIRMKIALDAARGLAYLHEDSQPCVIHRDFKASNILLENNFHAKVADFGLAKQAPEGRANYLSTRVMGTFGYVAPEYAMTGHLLVKSDVYSYGVVLLELLTGRKPVDMSQPSGQENLVTWARPILRDKDRLEELVDPRLEGKYPKEDFVRVCTIAAACVAPEANQRPTMGEVVQSLKMVQRLTEYHHDSAANTANPRPNIRQSSTAFESDGTSSMFSSGPYSGLSAFEMDISHTEVFSEDLHEGR